MPSLLEVISAIARNVQWSHHNPEDEQTVLEWLNEEAKFEAAENKPAEDSKTPEEPKTPKKEGEK